MPGPLVTTPFGVQDQLGVRAVAKISPNNRAITSTGSISTVADVYMFPFPTSPSLIGMWVTPNTRVLAGGVPTVGQTSVGITYTPVPGPPPALVPFGPMLPVNGDPRTGGA